MFLLLLVVAFGLAGVAEPYQTVYISRHCARSTPMQIYGGIDDFPFLSNFSNASFPPWGEPAYDCLPRGVEILKSFGKNLKHFKFPFPFKTTADTVNRDKTTAGALLEGLGVDPTDYDVDGRLFEPTANGVCDPLPNQTQIDEMQKTYNSIFQNATQMRYHKERLARLQNILGAGVAPPIQGIADFFSSGVWGGTLSGGTAVGSAIIEAFIMQVGGGLDVAWGRLDNVAELYSDLLEAHITYRHVMARTPVIAKYRHSNLLHHIILALDPSNATTLPGTRMYVGHDSDLDGLATILGLSWSSPPFPPNATTPGSGLRFDVFLGEKSEYFVKVDLYYTTFESDKAPIFVVPANFSHDTNVMKFSDFKKLAYDKMNFQCIS